MLKSLLQLLRRAKRHPISASPKSVPYIIARKDHRISRASISKNALTVLYRLKEAGFAAFLVGGGVRDILLERQPKDFDVATDARPEEMRQLFRNSRIIGRRFRLVHVFFGDEIIEVSTFRANAIEQTRAISENAEKKDMIYRDNTYGTIEEDAWRRDFTVNALYYTIADFSVIDYTNGMADLQSRLIRIIGDPTQRFHEDPIRLLRAIRLSAKLNFGMESETETTLKSLSHLLQHVPAARLYDECLKLFFEGNAFVTYQKLSQYNYLSVLFPQMVKTLSVVTNHADQALIDCALKATDIRFQSEEGVNPGFLFAVFLWPVLQHRLRHPKNKNEKFYLRLHQSIQHIIKTQTQTMMIPKRLQFTIQAIWILQLQLEKRRPSRVLKLFHHRYFRAAIDFMALRVRANELPSEILDWWKILQAADTEQQQQLIEKLG